MVNAFYNHKIVLYNNVFETEVNGLEYTITREMAPLYNYHEAGHAGFARGKRGIGGTFIPLGDINMDMQYNICIY